MKLRNKKTGEVLEMERSSSVIKDKFRIYDAYKNKFYTYSSLAELNAEWEDDEEPKGTYFINTQGDVQFWDSSSFAYPDDWTNEKEIGNYFETKEEAEKAVEKLKAWKRLKDKGFRFTLTPGVGSLDIAPGKFQIEITADMPEKWFCCDAVQEDLDACFGGEE